MPESWVERSFGHFGMAVALENAVRGGKRSVHAPLLVDGINEVE